MSNLLTTERVVKILDVREIKKLLQMTPPFLMLQSAMMLDNGNGFGVEICTTTAEISEIECAGHHFPAEVPLVHVCRVMAQTGCALLNFCHQGFISEVIGVERIKSHISKPIQPPLMISTRARVLRSGHGVHQLEIKSYIPYTPSDIQLAEMNKISYVLRRG